MSIFQMVEFNGFKIDLLSLIPRCEICQHHFDTFLRSPQILPCSHTFCLMCISKVKNFFNAFFSCFIWILIFIRR
ncbi:unnamed protein product [Enterobius vermicularis]|uniref:RING-type domain-containing protein n=1 Tax=Enterobius vermicularis TaxID=51028 RepID=A0A0N4UV86_ENTVE|nr:unnamed protein product [Enterobius vermicularis]